MDNAKKIGTLKLLIHKEKANLVCLNEIKCLEQEANGELNINGYESIIKCRSAKSSGVAIFISEKFDQIQIPSTLNDEVICIIIKFKNVKFTIYNPHVKD